MTDFTEDEKLRAIINWAGTTKSRFDTKWIVSVQENLENYGDLSPKQLSSVDNIIRKFRIDVAEHA